MLPVRRLFAMDICLRIEPAIPSCNKGVGRAARLPLRLRGGAGWGGSSRLRVSLYRCRLSRGHGIEMLLAFFGGAEDGFQLAGFVFERFMAGISEKTKLIIVASPNNPTGAVVSREHLLAIAAGAPPAIDTRPLGHLLSRRELDRRARGAHSARPCLGRARKRGNEAGDRLILMGA